MDDKKIIINVGRQLGSGGRIIASMLAKDFANLLYGQSYAGAIFNADRQLIALAQYLRVGIIALQEHTDGEIACLRIQAV